MQDFDDFETILDDEKCVDVCCELLQNDLVLAYLLNNIIECLIQMEQMVEGEANVAIEKQLSHVNRFALKVY